MNPTFLKYATAVNRVTPDNRQRAVATARNNMLDDNVMRLCRRLQVHICDVECAEYTDEAITLYLTVPAPNGTSSRFLVTVNAEVDAAGRYDAATAVWETQGAYSPKNAVRSRHTPVNAADAKAATLTELLLRDLAQEQPNKIQITSIDGKRRWSGTTRQMLHFLDNATANQKTRFLSGLNTN